MDAQTLARLARVDLQLLRPVKHHSAQAQADLTLIRLLRADAEHRSVAEGASVTHGVETINTDYIEDEDGNITLESSLQTN